MADNERSEPKTQERQTLTSAEITALSHLSRGQAYRSTIWRTRLDTTTNWAVVSLGVALSISYASPGASPLPLVLVGVLILLFLMQEARRYRYFNVWRARARWIETHFYAPLLEDGDLRMQEGWQNVLSQDYLRPRYHVTYATALGRRIRRNYLWILLIQALAYAGKIVIHPTNSTSLDEVITRADIGPLPGELVILTGLAYVLICVSLAFWSTRQDAKRSRAAGKERSSSMG